MILCQLLSKTMNLKTWVSVLILSWLLGSAFSEERIYGGHPVEITDVPYVAEVVAKTCKGSKCVDHYCGGSILRENLILTAAHCTVDKSTGKVYDAESFTVYVGSHLKKKGIEHEVKKAYAHPKYTGKKDHIHHDVAILELVEKVQLNERSQLVNLANSTDRPTVGDKGSVSGWGFNPQHQYDDRLFQVHLNIVSSKRCSHIFNDKEFDEHEICAQAPKKSTCQGDSGGPFIYLNSDRQVGIVSYGAKDCTKPAPSVFCRVTDNLDFIENIISKTSAHSSSHC